MRAEREAPAAAAAHIIEGDFMTPDQRETVALCLEEVAKAYAEWLADPCEDPFEDFVMKRAKALRPSQPVSNTDELRPVILRGAEAATNELFSRYDKGERVSFGEMRDLIAKHMTAAIPALDTSSPEGGTLELYARDGLDNHNRPFYERIPEAEAVIEAARKLIKTRESVSHEDHGSIECVELGPALELEEALSAFDKRRPG